MARTADQQAEQVRADIGEVIRDASTLLLEVAHPEKVIRFGSYGRGDFTMDSELDVGVMLSTADDTFEEMMRLERVLLALPVPVGVLV